MPGEKSLRRDFLRVAGLGVVGAAVGARTSAQQPAVGAGAESSGTERPGVDAGVFDVRNYGATGDGVAIDSVAINRAIAGAAAFGGGTVHFPAGKYLCCSLRLKSGVGLYLDQGAVIIAAEPSPGASGEYDLAEPNTAWDAYQDYGHNHWRNSLLWGEGLENISILGPGLIWGRGLSKGYGPGPLAERAGVANKAIALKNCRNVILRDFSVLKGGHFAVLATGVDNFTIDNLKVDTDRDGIDIDCCRNVRVTNCTVNSPWDDGICPKSSYALGYARATENVTIANCYVTGNYQLGSVLDGTFKPWDSTFKGGRTGRIKFGTESNGGFKNIAIANCVFEGCMGLALETVDGGLLEDVSITNITMRDIVSAPIFLRLGSRMRGPRGAAVGALRRIMISNIVCSNADSRLSSIISGIPGHAVEDVTLSDIYVEHRGGREAATMAPPENAEAYPEPEMFGDMPAQGFFVRHARNIEMNHVEIRAIRQDRRAVVVLQDVDGARFYRMRAAAKTRMFSLKSVRNFEVGMSQGVGDVKLPEVDERLL